MSKQKIPQAVMVDLSIIQPNPNNPRFIRDDKFQQLVKSIQEFPKMLFLRPIVLNQDNMPLGGNMRYRAAMEAGLKEVPVLYADTLTEDEQRRFVITDNVGFGEWDWERLANEWDEEELTAWGLDTVWKGSDVNNMTEDDLDLTERFDPIGTSKDQQRVVFIFSNPEEAEKYLNDNSIIFEKRNMAWQVSMVSPSI